MSVTNSKPAIQQRPAVQQTMGFTPRRDPIPCADKDLLGRDPTKIKHNGGIDSQEAFCIVHKYETEDEKQKRENIEEYGYEATDVQLSIQNECFYSGYDDGWGSSFAYDQDTYDYYGTYSDAYIEMVESGEVVHGEFSCSVPNMNMGASFEGEEQTAEVPEITPEQQAFLDANTTEPQGELTTDEPTTPAQQSFLDANTTEPQGELTTAFSAAADPDPVVQPAPTLAANNPTYQAPAMSA